MKEPWKTGTKRKFIIIIATIVILICLCCVFVIFAPKVFPLPSTPISIPTSTITNTSLPTATLPIDTPKPTNTPNPTNTLGPTSTSKPTNTPNPTNTLGPTSTSRPTNTPKFSYIPLSSVASLIFYDHDVNRGNGKGVKVYMGELKTYIFEIIGGGDCPSMPSGQGYLVRYPNGNEEWKDRRAMEEAALFVVDDSKALYSVDWKIYYNCP